MEKSIEKALNDLGSAVKEHLDREGQILSAMDAFSVLLRQQLERIDNMQTDKVDFSQKETVTIGVINGDGIGEIIVPQAKRVLEALLADEIQSGNVVVKQIQGLTIENRLALGGYGLWAGHHRLYAAGEAACFAGCAGGHPLGIGVLLDRVPRDRKAAGHAAFPAFTE